MGVYENRRSSVAPGPSRGVELIDRNCNALHIPHGSACSWDQRHKAILHAESRSSFSTRNECVHFLKEVMMYMLDCRILQRGMWDCLVLDSHSRESYCLLLRYSFVCAHISCMCVHMQTQMCAWACQTLTSAIIPLVLSTLLILRQSLWSFEWKRPP